MKIKLAFWKVIYGIFGVRPITILCCNCEKIYLLTAERIAFDIKFDGEDTPVIECPYCGLKHALVMYLAKHEPGLKEAVLVEIDEQ